MTPPDWPDVKAGAIEADPAWHFTAWSDKATRHAGRHYPTMTREEIMALPVADLAADDCALFLWATYPNLQQGLDTLAAWGFTYSTVAFTWAKVSKNSGNSFAPKWHMGLGYWTRSNAEICLLGYRGKPKRLNKDVRQLIVAPVREHSRKPDEAYERIERLVAGPYVSLFARQQRPNWITWGNQTDKWEAAV